MVERGMKAPVVPDEWVPFKSAKTRRTYVGMGIEDQTEIEFLLGPPSIRGVGTYQFLHNHLNSPQR